MTHVTEHVKLIEYEVTSNSFLPTTTMPSSASMEFLSSVVDRMRTTEEDDDK